MPAVLALVVVTAVWGLTFVMVQDAIDRFGVDRMVDGYLAVYERLA